MTPIDALIQQAREKRDNAIATARAEYREAVASINKLATTLRVAERKTPRPSGAPVFAMVESCIPDAPFECGDLLAAIREAAPSRDFTTGTVRTYLRMLCDRGVILRVARGDRNRTVWERDPAYQRQDRPFASWFIPDAAEHVLREVGPLRVVELVFALQERGYRADAEPEVLANSVAKALGYHPERFAKGRDGRWGLAKEGSCPASDRY